MEVFWVLATHSGSAPAFYYSIKKGMGWSLSQKHQDKDLWFALLKKQLYYKKKQVNNIATISKINNHQYVYNDLAKLGRT